MMKKIITILTMSCIVAFVACGPSAKEIKEKATQDSIRKADSIAKLVVEVESWEIYLAASKNEAEFKSKFENKKVRVKNLVVSSVWGSKQVIQCMAYSPGEMMVSNPSRDGDAKKKLTKIQDNVQGAVCKYNTDLISFSWYVKLNFKAPVDVAGIKDCEIKNEPSKFGAKYPDRYNNYPTILTVEGDSVAIVSNEIVMKNCVIIDNKTK
jgi:hypothetical protein